jgi:glycyl-tRNA synthetase
MKDKYEKILMLAKRRGFFYPSFEIYGGASGFWDWGPLGCLLKRNLEDLWRSYYLFKEGMVEIECPILTPYRVLKASGHVDKFVDKVLRCKKCGHQWDPSIGDRCPECGGELVPFTTGLMFESKMGRGEEQVVYLRPETAQGIFLNFLNLYRYFRKHLPFGVCQIGRSYRNELSPRKAILRLKEFSMMEAEIFFDPEEKWEKFAEQKEKKLILLPQSKQSAISLTLEEVVRRGLISSVPLAYYLGLSQDYLTDAGLDPLKLRFRQHRQEELAHYAKECWDAEAYSERFGWVEVAGIADRTTYDLKVHSRASERELAIERELEQAKVIEEFKIQPQMERIGSLFKDKSQKVKTYLEKIDPRAISSELKIKLGSEEYLIPSDCYKIVKTKERATTRKLFPHIIEPSYGIDRIIYLLLEHSYKEIEKRGERYAILGFKPWVAPIKAGVFPLVKKDGLPELARKVNKELKEERLITYYDEVGSIGRRYARMDEIGAPFCITIDYESLENETVTLRDRDTAKQSRIKIKELSKCLKKELSRH